MSNVTSIDDIRERFAKRKSAASKKRVDAMASTAIAYLNKSQQAQAEKSEMDRLRDVLEMDLRIVCQKAYAWFPVAEADEMLKQMLPFVQTAEKLKIKGGP